MTREDQRATWYLFLVARHSSQATFKLPRRTNQPLLCRSRALLVATQATVNCPKIYHRPPSFISYIATCTVFLFLALSWIHNSFASSHLCNLSSVFGFEVSLIPIWAIPYISLFLIFCLNGILAGNWCMPPLLFSLKPLLNEALPGGCRVAELYGPN